jgi:hypothetical protein
MARNTQISLYIAMAIAFSLGAILKPSSLLFAAIGGIASFVLLVIALNDLIYFRILFLNDDAFERAIYPACAIALGTLAGAGARVVLKR